MQDSRELVRPQGSLGFQPPCSPALDIDTVAVTEFPLTPMCSGNQPDAGRIGVFTKL
jgi:hypothetical protein